jgi:hypothetical protein
LVAILAEALLDPESSDLSILFIVLVLYGVGTLSSQPLVCPIIQYKGLLLVILVITFLQGTDEVSETCVGPSVLLEVDLQTITEGVPSHQEDELLQQTSAFSISDSVNQRFRDISVFTFSLNIVVGGHQIIIESPSLVASKVKPRFILEFFHMLTTEGASIIGKRSGETFVEPEILPPFHSDKVSEPHVSQLMLNHNTEEGELRHRHML